MDDKLLKPISEVNYLTTANAWRYKKEILATGKAGYQEELISCLIRDVENYLR